eukprot:COSAG05_NODE_3507_length_2021_cov_7.707076_2_plen_45_part_01
MQSINGRFWLRRGQFSLAFHSIHRYITASASSLVTMAHKKVTTLA